MMQQTEGYLTLNTRLRASLKREYDAFSAKRGWTLTQGVSDALLQQMVSFEDAERPKGP